MTCREKLEKEHPENINFDCFGGCIGCPDDYGYLPKLSESECQSMRCTSCWDREIPGTEKNVVKNLYNWEEIHKLIETAMEKRDRLVSLYFNPETGMSVSVYPWPDYEDLYQLYEDGKITMNDFREKMGLAPLKAKG